MAASHKIFLDFDLEFKQKMPSKYITGYAEPVKNSFDAT